MRLWLTAAFAAVSLITVAAVYFFGDNEQALIGAVMLGVLAGFLIAVAISHRVVGLARAAGEMAGGSFDAPLTTSGPDEIGDLARALDSMRASLKESFGVLSSDRNKLAAIFDGLTDVVMVVDYEGPVRFSNSAAARLLDESGQPPEVVLPQLHRAAEVGFSAHPALRIGDRAYAMTARSLPDERARSWPKPTSSPTQRTSCATPWLGSPARSRSCRAAPRTTRRTATTSSSASAKMPSG
jgi:HAMP domain-containing protein